MVLSNSVWIEVIVDDKDNNLCDKYCPYKDVAYCWLVLEKLDNKDGVCKRDECCHIAMGM